MSRYIDAKWLQDKAYKMNFDQRITERELALVNYLIGISKPIDIVRCKECKSYIDFIGEQFINAPTLCGRLSTLDNYVAVNADDFCSYGERKESE